MTIQSRWRHYSRHPWLREALETLAARLLILGLGLVNAVLVARLLGPEGRGITVAATTLAAMAAQLGCLGLPAANLFQAARNPANLPALVGNSLLVTFAIGGSLSAVLWMVLAIFPGLSPVRGTALAIAVAWIPLQIAYNLAVNALLGLHCIRRYNILEVGVRVGTVLSVLALLLAGCLTSNSVLMMSLAVCALFLALSGLSLRRNLDSRPHVSFPLLVSSIDYGYKIYIGTFTSYLITNFDLLMVARMLGNRDAGLYSVAGLMGNLILLISGAAQTILMPKMAARPNFADRWVLARKAAWITGSVAALLCLASIGLAGPAIRLLLGSAYLPAREPFLWLLPGLVCLTVMNVTCIAAGAAEQPLATIVAGIVIAGFNIAANVYCIPHFGILGAAVTSTLSYTFLMLANFWFIDHYFVRGPWGAPVELSSA